MRLHLALMPDYNPGARRYWWSVTLAGGAALAHSMVSLSDLSASAWLQVLAGVALTMLAAIFPVRVSHAKHSFAVGEIFVFLLLLMQGTAAATVAAAAEGAVGSFRTSKRWTSRLVSPAAAALAMLVAGTLLETALVAMQRQGLTNDGLIIVGTMSAALLNYLVNGLLVTSVPRLKQGLRLKLADLREMFGWMGVASAGSAAVSALLFITYRQSGFGVLMAVVPVIAMLVATLHYVFRQQELNEVVRVAAAMAAEREALAAARHVRELEASERRFHSAFTHASIGMSLLSFGGEILQTNTAMRELLGRSAEDLAHRNIRDLVCADDLPALTAELAQLQAGQVEDIALELRCLHRDGSTRWVATHGSLFSEIGASSPCLILQAHDITARRDAEEGLQHIAFHDALTGLPNRRRFHEHLSSAVQDARDDPARRFAVMFLDFDRFKLINDSLGHNAGDEFLVQVARRLTEKLRPNDVVARLGGDEFAVLARELEHDDDVIHLAERLLAALRLPFQVAGTELNTSASIGITRSSFGYASTEDVLRDADIAMYKAKAAGKARYALFDSSLHAQVSRRLQLEGDLRVALAAGQLGVVYQPLFTLGDGHLSGFEALARWRHPTLGPIGPDVFIPIAEEAGLILQLTDMVLAQACRQLKSWQGRDAHFDGLTIQVNVSGKDLSHAGLVGRVSQALLESGVAARHLTLELTENILMKQIESALPMLEQLRSLGVGLSVDDFGTGYSSLSHLSMLPIDSLKVDRSFVHGLHKSAREAAVVRAVVQLGNSLGKSVVAEGIETPDQLAQLREMGCDLGQGFHLGFPLMPQEVNALLDSLLASETGAAPRAAPLATPPARVVCADAVCSL
ncbi:bifunctional diguanylate cyclase/phosphodiesterase [Ideonella sp. A 288]|uniref:putative bifunctional diguanylate cyclase/phosphodiesterase n=1 Tax=Ideonella sp. A 288 TaxID=1962181 RepID=UPI000B4BCC09|nr:EAL domain-containing protein [Ideonella sp. A 288]